MDVLVTGAAGFIGYHTACRLAERGGVRLLLVDNLQRGRADAAFRALCERPDVRFESRDLTDPGSLADLGHYDAIYHFAAMVGVEACVRRPAAVLRTNLLSTLNVVDFAARVQTGRLLFASTSEVYSGGHDLGVVSIPTAEDAPFVISDPANPRFSYAGSKLVGEQIVRFSLAEAGVPFHVVRFHNVYGPRMGYAHVIPEVVRRVFEGEDPLRVIAPEQTRAFCYVDDAVRAVEAIMEGAPAPLYHIGTAEETSIGDLYERILACTGRDPRRVAAPGPPGSVRRRCPDIGRLRRDTGFEPAVSLEQGLKRTVDWYLADLAAEARAQA